MSIATKLNRLCDTKDYIRQCIQQKGVTVPASNTFHDYGDRILEIETEQHPPDWNGEIGELEIGTAIPTGVDFVLNPSEGYGGFSAVNVLGDSNLTPENIAEGISIYGVTGTLSKDFSDKAAFGVPLDYQHQLGEAVYYLEKYLGHEYDMDVVHFDYEHLMILENSQALAFGFMLSGFKINAYDVSTTEFKASKWIYVAYNKQTYAWKVEPWENSTSNGNSYIKNIRYCDVYLWYNNVIVYPIAVVIPDGQDDDYTSDFTAPVLPALNEWFEFYIKVPSDLSVKFNLGQRYNTSYPSNSLVEAGDGQGKTVSVTSASTTTLTYRNDGIVLFRVYGGERSVWVQASATNSNIIVRFRRALPPHTLSITRLFAGDKNITDVPKNLFSECSRVTTATYLFNAAGITTLREDIFYDMPKINDISYMFKNCKSLSDLPSGLFRNLDGSVAVKTEELFYGCTSLSRLPKGFFSFPISSLYSTFRESGISSIDGIFEKSALSTVTTMYGAFRGCISLTSIPDDFIEAIPSTVTNISYMFDGCTSLTFLPELWDTDKYGEKFENMGHIHCFQNCKQASNYTTAPLDWK